MRKTYEMSPGVVGLTKSQQIRYDLMERAVAVGRTLPPWTTWWSELAPLTKMERREVIRIVEEQRRGVA